MTVKRDKSLTKMRLQMCIQKNFQVSPFEQHYVMTTLTLLPFFLTRLDSVNQWMCPDVFWGIPNFLHDFKVLPQCTYVPKFGCPNP